MEFIPCWDTFAKDPVVEKCNGICSVLPGNKIDICFGNRVKHCQILNLVFG